MAGHIFIGTSGWSYKAWAADFYPAGLPAKRHFDHYATRFPTVEINATFYRLPSVEGVHQWRAKAPPGFSYAIKGSRTVTHYFKLQPGAKSYELLMTRIEPLAETLGPVLWQLPPGFGKELDRLERFLGTLPKRYRHALEVRDPSWLDEEVFACLRRHRVAHVSVSAGWFPRDLTLTTDFTYVRFHGLEGGPAHHYSRRELRPWATHLRACAERGLDAYVYFNNDIDVRAPYNAETLMEMVAPYAVRPAPPPAIADDTQSARRKRKAGSKRATGASSRAPRQAVARAGQARASTRNARQRGS